VHPGEKEEQDQLPGHIIVPEATRLFSYLKTNVENYLKQQ
jgi:hypothetical protein